MAQGNPGVLFNNLRGKAGSVVFARSKDGTVIRPRVTGRNPRTPAQVAVRNAMTKASQAYKNMTPAQVANWQNYALTVTKHDPRTGKSYNPSAIAAFTALASKFALINPTGTIPLTPPTAAFNGDTITVTATGGAGAITFTASAANAANIKTELLLQPLKSRNRTPQPKGYRSKMYMGFVAMILSANVSVPAGWYAAGYRFVNTLTGQESPIIPLTVQQATFAIEEHEPVKLKKAA